MNQNESRIPTFPSSKTTLILKNPLTTRNSNTEEVPQRPIEKEQIISKPKLILNPATTGTEKKKQVPITPNHSFNYTRKDFTIVKQKMEELQAENENLKVERAQNLLKIRQLEKKLNQEKEEKEKLHKELTEKQQGEKLLDKLSQLSLNPKESQQQNIESEFDSLSFTNQLNNTQSNLIKNIHQLYETLDMLGVDYREIEVPVNIRKNIAENYNEEIIKQCEIGVEDDIVDVAGVDEEDMFKMLASMHIFGAK